MTTAESTPAAPRRRVSVRRQQLAEEFLASMKALKRRMELAVPADLSEEVGGVTTHQLEALVWLMSSPGGIPMNDLARAQGVGLSSCTALADRLVRHGLAERSADPTDRRVVRLAATARAQASVEHFQKERRAVLIELLAALDDDEVATVNRLLGAMARAASPEAQR
ncbi:MAG TPA: MarR family transcriptional regulator [Candidatus Dormibacteraeota bacterium]